MRRVLLSAAAVLFALTAAEAHPAVGIVVDTRGNVFYSDLEQVWRIAPDGTRAVAVPNVHTHELYLDERDNLYGEHLWYEGDATKKFDHYFWRRSADGRVVTIVPAHHAFSNEDDPSFVRDRAGSMYWADRAHNAIMKRTAVGQKSVLARGDFHDIRWMTVTPDRTVYFVDTLDLMRVTPDGKLTVMARKLSSDKWIDTGGAHHQIMGLWTDRRGNVYAADNENRAVKRVDPNGRVTVVARSTFPWSVTGGTFAANGDLWLMESTITSAVRVRRIDAKIIANQ